MKRLDTHLRLSASCKQVSSMVYPTLVTMTPSPPSPTPVVASLTEDLGQASPMQQPFNVPTIDQEQSQANEHLGTVVVPQVLSVSSVDEKILALCEGIYSYFSRMYGVLRKEGKNGRSLW